MLALRNSKKYFILPSFALISLFALLDSSYSDTTISTSNDFNTIYLSQEEDLEKENTSQFFNNGPFSGTITKQNNLTTKKEELKEKLKKEAIAKKAKKRFPHPLSLSEDDIKLRKVVVDNQVFYDLIIRKKRAINSVLLTNYYWKTKFRDRTQEYGLRSIRPISIARNEKRLYKNTLIGYKQKLYFIVDSSTEKDPNFDKAFRLRIPSYVIYGYKKTKEIYGIIKIQSGIKINIRTFSRKFTSYKGAFYDNPIGLILEPRKNYPSNISLTKINETLDDSYLSTNIMYSSDRTFFKSFLIRSNSDNDFHSINFDTKKGDKKALLIEAFYEGKSNKTVFATIYFRRIFKDVTYEIVASDVYNNRSSNSILVTIPKYGEVKTPISPPPPPPPLDEKRSSNNTTLDKKVAIKIPKNNSSTNTRPQSAQEQSFQNITPSKETNYTKAQPTKIIEDNDLDERDFWETVAK